MPTLHDLQSGFRHALLDPSQTQPDDVTSHTKRHPAKRFNVYRNNVIVSLTDALKAQFPAIARLVGEQTFRNLAATFIRAHPPTSPLLMNYGEAFPGFLTTISMLDSAPYLHDVAQLEWLWSRAYHAADATPTPIEVLGAIPPEELADMRVTLLPSTQLLASKFPVISIWETNRDDDQVRPVDLAVGGEDVLIARPELDVEVRRLPPGMHALLTALLDGQSLGTAAETAARSTTDFDLTLVLTLLIRSRTITQIC